MWLLVWASRAAPRRGEPNDPVQIARLRYARGELNRGEFEALWRDLE